jgi:hypothetical protein
MTTQPEALRLADALGKLWLADRQSSETRDEAAAELRRLHAVNQELLEALTHVSDWFTAAGIDVPAVRHARAIEAALRSKNHE